MNRKAVSCPDMGLNEKLEKFLAERGWTAKHLASAVGTTGASVGRWLNKKGQPTGRHLHNLARVMRVPIEYLTDDSLEAPPAPELTDAERYLVQLIRDSGLSRDVVAQAILALARQAPGRHVATVRGGPVVPDSEADADSEDQRSDRARSPLRRR